MIKGTETIEELWSAANSSYLEWSRAGWSDSEWVDQAKRTLNLYKKFLQLSMGQYDEIKCRAQIGKVLFQGATRLGENKRVIPEGIDKLVNASRALAELEKALSLDAQWGGEFFNDSERQELYLPVLEELWVLQAKHLKKAAGKDEAFAYLKKKMSMMESWDWPYMANACSELGGYYSAKRQNHPAIFWFHKAIRAADTCHPDSAVYQLYQDIKENAQADIASIEISPAPALKNGRGSIVAARVPSPALKENAAHSESMPDALPQQALIEKLFNTTFPDWQVLLQSAEKVKKQKPPFATVRWAEQEATYSSRALFAIGEYDIRAMEDGLCLFTHERLGCLAKLLGLFRALIASLLAPLHRLKDRLETLLLTLANRLNKWFAFLSIPFAIIAFFGDFIAMLFSFLGSMMSLLFSPLLLLRELFLLPFRLLAAFLSRLIRTLLLAWIARLLNSAAQKFLEMMLRRYPWLRGILLGFFRRERPIYPVLIPRIGVNQVLLMKRRGLFVVQEFLVIVEGGALQIGLRAWLAYKIKKLVFPFYWERTIHMILLNKKDREKVIHNVYAALGRSTASGNEVEKEHSYERNIIECEPLTAISGNEVDEEPLKIIQKNNSPPEAESLYHEGLMQVLRSTDEDLGEGEQANSAKRSIQLFQEALDLGLTGKEEVSCRAWLANDLLFPKSEEEMRQVVHNGLNGVAKISQAVSQFERALKLDRERGGEFFGNQNNRHALFPSFAVAWLMQSHYLKESRGQEGITEAISYLQKKLKLLDYIGGSHMPDMCLEIGYLAATGNITEISPADWFRKTIEAEDFGLYQDTKSLAQGNLAKLKQSGCFIATAVYGTPTAFEVKVLKNFRELFLRPYQMGRIVIALYETFSPTLAKFIARFAAAKYIIRLFFVHPVYLIVRAFLKNSKRGET